MIEILSDGDQSSALGPLGLRVDPVLLKDMMFGDMDINYFEKVMIMMTEDEDDNDNDSQNLEGPDGDHPLHADDGD